MKDGQENGSKVKIQKLEITGQDSHVVLYLMNRPKEFVSLV